MSFANKRGGGGGSKKTSKGAESPKKKTNGKGMGRNLSPMPDKNRRDSTGSNSSVDSRAVAAELEADDIDELLGVVDDVQGFKDGLKNKTGDIPRYISRKHIMEEFTKVLNWKDGEVSNERKAQVIDLAKHLVAMAKKEKDHDECLKIMLAPVIAQLASKEREVQNACIRFLQMHHKEEKNRNLIVESLAEKGLGNRSHKVCIETAKLVPGIFMPYLDETNILPVILKLHKQLGHKERETYCFGALLRCQEVMGIKNFNKLEEKVPSKDQALFKSMTQNYEDKDYHISKKRPNDGVSFGMITNPTINRVTDKTDRHVRGDGSLALRQELMDNKEDLSLLLPYMGSFVKFLGGLLQDRNPKVGLVSLECHHLLLKHAPATMKQHAEITTFNLLKVSMDARPQLKAELYRTMQAIMVCCGVMNIVEILVLEIDHKNPRMREDIITYLIHALLVFPSSDFDLEYFCERIVPYISDPKRRVRQGSLEICALLSSYLGEKKKKLLDKAVDQAERDSDDHHKEMIKTAVKGRIGRKVLPRITEEGYVEYGLQIPHDYYARNIFTPKGRHSRYSTVLGGTDVEWVLRGTGALSRGTANFFASHLIVNQGRGEFGSTASLRSLRDSGGKNDADEDNDRADSGGSLNRHSKVPDINQSQMDDEEYDDEEDDGEATGGFEDGDTGVIESIDREEDILALWRSNEREMSDEEKEEHERSYSAKTKSESLVDLREAVEKKNGLIAVTEDPKRKAVFHKKSLRDLKLADTKFKTLFEEEEGKDDELPGAFKDPEKAFQMAIKDLNSMQWETEMDGLEVIVRLVKYHPLTVVNHIKDVNERLMHECRNLRSQVARAAIQTYTLLFVHLDRAMETRGVEDIAEILFTKSADTNKFIREDANEALRALTERLCVHRAVEALIKGGLNHKSSLARTGTARLLADVVAAVGGSQMMAEPDTRDMILSAGVKLLSEGKVDTRKEAKRMFSFLVDQPKFMEICEKASDKSDFKHAKGSLKQVKEEKEGGGKKKKK